MNKITKAMQYKRVPRIVPWCSECNQTIQGNGSISSPYTCDCGTWESGKNGDYFKKEKHGTTASTSEE